MGRLAGVASVLAAPWPTGLLSLGGVAPAMALWLHGQVPQIIDQDEFAEAAVVYGYSEAFMGQCYELAEALLGVLAGWQPRGATSAQLLRRDS